MKQPSLFDSDYDQAVRDMILELRRLFATSTDAYERCELRLAIRSWENALEPPMPNTPPHSTQAPQGAK
jgi:hypothetical protein